ncbi:MAG TPA: glycoside hydrolase family 88 protein, partial [Gammaproteobacteria bacterium]
MGLKSAQLISRVRHFGLAALILLATATQSAEIESLEIGLATDGRLIEALRVGAGQEQAPTIALVGGLPGDDESSGVIRDALEQYAELPDSRRASTVIAVPVANPAQQPLQFPPTGPAYREHAESHALWRWLGLNAPDLVLVVGADPASLGEALQNSTVAGVAPLAVRALAADQPLLEGLAAELTPSAARQEIEARRARSPTALAGLLAPIYSQSFDTALYIDGMGLIAHLGLGNVDHVAAVAEPFLTGERDSLGGRFGVSTLVLAGHLVFAELAARTGDPRALERARAAADLAFDDTGGMLEAMPGHGEMSDAIFMGAGILAAVGDLTGERPYFDMAARHIAFMNTLVRRDDGLYRHSPLTDAAWGRGNGFAAIGYALTLSNFPADHPAWPRLLEEYRSLMATLASWQNADGTWRQVVDFPGAYHETSSTAIIGFSMQRGLNRGWLEPAAFEPGVERAFGAVSQRTDGDGGFIDVSE